jgi:hypothetical protein
MIRKTALAPIKETTNITNSLDYVNLTDWLYNSDIQKDTNAEDMETDSRIHLNDIDTTSQPMPRNSLKPKKSFNTRDGSTFSKDVLASSTPSSVALQRWSKIFMDEEYSLKGKLGAPLFVLYAIISMMISISVLKTGGRIGDAFHNVVSFVVPIGVTYNLADLCFGDEESFLFTMLLGFILIQMPANGFVYHYAINVMWVSMMGVIAVQTGQKRIFLKLFVAGIALSLCTIVEHYLGGKAYQYSFVYGCYILLVSYNLCELARFITHRYARVLSEQEAMKQLIIKNRRLKNQLYGLYGTDSPSSLSPLQNAVALLQDMISRPENSETLLILTEILNELMNSENLVEVLQDMQDSSSEIDQWLKTEFQSNHLAQGISSSSIENSFNDADGPAFFNRRSSVNRLSVELATSAIAKLLSTSSSPEFDVFHLEALTNGHALYYLATHIFSYRDVSNLLGISPTAFSKWVSKVEIGYRSENPYHNSSHAADVLHSVVYFMSQDNVSSFFSIEEFKAGIIAAIIHDYRHPGVNNAFLVETRDPLAQLYNDLGVLENFHSASFFEMRLEKELDIFEYMKSYQRIGIRKTIIEMVLATDMSTHFETLGTFKTKLAISSMNLENSDDKKLFLNITIKCADVNAPTKLLLQARQWAECVMQEFFKQGDEEKKRGIPLSGFMDRNTVNIPKAQLVYYGFTVGIHWVYRKAAIYPV